MTDLQVPLKRRFLEPSGLARKLERTNRREGSLFRERIPSAWRHVDIVLPVVLVVISVLSALMVLSSTRGTDPDSYDLGFMQRQIGYSIVGILLMFLLMAFDYRRIRSVAWAPWAVAIALLVVVMVAGDEARGSQRWFDLGVVQIQPAELAKIAVVVIMAAVLARRRLPLRARWVLLALATLVPPVALILLQPDLGTALAFGAVALGILLMAGTRVRHLAVLTAAVVLAGVWVLTSDVLEDYQRQRLTTFLDQDRGLGEQTYNLNQSKIALGSGGASGKGLFEGTQTRLGNVPEQHTDFIFAALGEELGFTGSATLLGLYGVVLWRIWRAAQVAADRFGTLLCVGVLTLLAFQIFQNIGMTMGLMPITGLPLPFMSYGGSSVIASWMAIGIVENVYMRRFR